MKFLIISILVGATCVSAWQKSTHYSTSSYPTESLYKPEAPYKEEAYQEDKYKPEPNPYKAEPSPYKAESSYKPSPSLGVYPTKDVIEAIAPSSYVDEAIDDVASSLASSSYVGGGGEDSSYATSYDKGAKEDYADKTQGYDKPAYNDVSEYNDKTGYNKEQTGYDDKTGYDQTQYKEQTGYEKGGYKEQTGYDKTDYKSSPDYKSKACAPIQNVPLESRSIQELYSAALKEGGKLIVYAGGDAPGQATNAKLEFEKKFPGLSVEMIVDLSKIHDARLDNQLATNTRVPDVIQLQTLQDFPRWKCQGVLHPYKPIGWEQVYPEFKDSDGYSTGIHIWSFANNINRELLGNDTGDWPSEAGDYTNPELRGQIISTYPNDDDAVLFLYKLWIEKHGWDWLAKFVANKPTFVRSTQNPFDALQNATFAASFTTAGSLRPKVNSPVQFWIPKKDPFVMWGQRASILKGTKRLNAAKLYLSWWLQVETQRDFWFQWSVRKDVPAPKGYRGVFEYPGQADPVAFERFFEDRTALEIFKNQVQLYVGAVVGKDPAGVLGLHPRKMLPEAFA